MDVSPPPAPPAPPQYDDPIITQFKPAKYQWELNDDNLNRIDPETGRTILHNYCRHINATPVEVYRYLIEVKGCDVNVRDKYNDTPIHEALRNFNLNRGGDITVLMYLLTQTNIDVNTKGQYGFTLFHAACFYSNNLLLQIFKLLIETLGCDVNIRDNYNDTAHHRAINRFNSNKDDDITILQYLLSQEGVNGNIKGQFDDTLLHAACKYINTLPLDIFKVLIETMGCEVNAQNDDKDTPLHNALGRFNPNKGGDITALTYLINKNNIDLNIKNEKGRNLLHYACTNNLPSYQRSAELDAECDTIFSQIVEFIAERCIQEGFEENNLK